MNEFPQTITFQKKTTVSDNAGGYTESWDFYKDAEAHVQPVSGNVYYLAQQSTSNITHEIFLNYDSDIHSNLRIKHGNEVLNITSVIDSGGLNEVLMLMCESYE